MNHINIKWKLGLLAALAALGFASLITYNTIATSTLMKFNNISQQTIQLEKEMLTLRRHEKDFIARKDLKYLAKFDKTFVSMDSTLSNIEQALHEVDIEEKHTKELKNNIQSYKQQFATLVKQQQTIGLHAEDGLYGSLRSEVHQIESLLTKQEESLSLTTDVNSLMRTMLMLRRHEKDFMLRRNMKYVDKFDKRITIMQSKIDLSKLPNSFKQKAKAALENYNQQFLELVDGEKTFGLTSKEGIHGEMRNTIHQAEKTLKKFHQFSEENVEQYLKNKTIIDILVGLCLILITISSLILIARGISMRITGLSQLMTIAAKDKNLSLRAESSGHDEISSMAKIYNEMMSEFNMLMTEVKDSSLALAQAAKELKSSSEETQLGVNRQLNDGEQVVAAMTQVSTSVSEVANKASEAAIASSATDQASLKGQQLVIDNRQSFEKLVIEIEKSGDIITNLSTESNNIEAMLNDIRSNAEQTNLLALNAAIEAARAGEQGRGFAVVADEVRTLAQRAASSTLEIENVVTRLQSLADDAVITMNLGKTQAEESSKNTNNVELALNDIKQSTETIDHMNRDIATASEQQSVVAQDINQNLKSIVQVAHHTATLTDNISVSSEQLQKLSDQLAERVLLFKLS